MSQPKKKTFKKIILDALKANDKADLVKKVKSVRYSTFSMGNALDIEVLGATDDERQYLKDFLEPYEYGTFCSMTDCQGTKNRDAKVERQAKYVHVQHIQNEELI